MNELLLQVKLERAEESLHDKQSAIHALGSDLVKIREERDAALNEVARLTAAFDSIRAIHRPFRSSTLGCDYCGGCGGPGLTPWPCELVRAVDSVVKR